MIAFPAVFIGYEHGLMRGVFFFVGIFLLVVVSMFVPYLRERRKYGSNPFK